MNQEVQQYRIYVKKTNLDVEVVNGMAFASARCTELNEHKDADYSYEPVSPTEAERIKSDLTARFK